jgi:hypothetical protein
MGFVCAAVAKPLPSPSSSSRPLHRFLLCRVLLRTVALLLLVHPLVTTTAAADPGSAHAGSVPIMPPPRSESGGGANAAATTAAAAAVAAAAAAAATATTTNATTKDNGASRSGFVEDDDATVRRYVAADGTVFKFDRRTRQWHLESGTKADAGVAGAAPTLMLKDRVRGMHEYALAMLLLVVDSAAAAIAVAQPVLFIIAHTLSARVDWQ